MRYIGIFEGITGAAVKDCILRPDSILFVVDPGNAGKAIGRRGVNVERASKVLQKRVEVVEYAEPLETFVKSIFLPARISAIEVLDDQDGKKRVQIHPHQDDQGLAIGKNGRNIDKARVLLKRYYDIDHVDIK
jgi:N utilization substance protein A